MKFIPDRGHYLVKRDSAPEKSEGGILLPGTVEEKIFTAKVITVGEPIVRYYKDGKTTDEPMEYKAGDKVLLNFSRDPSYQPLIKTSTGDYEVVNSYDILGKFEE